MNRNYQEPKKIQNRKDDFKNLIAIIKDVTGIDVKEHNTRQRYIVNAKMIFSKILRDNKYTLKSIGREIGKDHSTVLHYTKKWDVYALTDYDLKNNYKIVSELFESSYIDLSELKRDDKEKMVQNLTLENNILNLKLKEKNQEIAKLNKQTSNLPFDSEEERLKDIIDLVKERTKKGKEDVVLNKLRRIFNGI